MVIRLKGDRQIVVELPGIEDPERALNLIGETAILEFVEAEWVPGDLSLLSEDEKELLLGKDYRLDTVKFYDRAGNVVREAQIVLKKTVLTGNELKWAGPGTNEYGQPNVSIEFTSEGATKFQAITTRSVGKPLAILLDGVVISAPNINEPITGGRAQISGGFSITEVQDLVIKLKAGSLPIPVKIVENRIIGPLLGKDAIEKSKIAAYIGFSFVALFMIGYYRGNGFIAIIALLIYAILDLTVLSLFNATLTLPGIAGLILSIGMAVDANIIIFERFKEELKLGKTLVNALESSFKRAFHTIFDANVTTIIAAVVLFYLGTGSIKGFAVTLIIGILTSMFTAILVTKLFLTNLARAKLNT